MASLLPSPPTRELISDAKGLCTVVWWKWFARLQLFLAPYLPSMSGPNQILGTNEDGTANEYKTLAGTPNQVNVINSPGVITLSTPQDIDAAAAPTFAGLTVNDLTADGLVYADDNKKLASVGLMDGQIAIGSTGNPPVAANLIAGSGITISEAPGAIMIAAEGTSGGNASRAYAARH